MEVSSATLGEVASPHADHGMTFGHAAFHCGDDLTGKRNLSIGQGQQ
jgi:hypothetical protein